MHYVEITTPLMGANFRSIEAKELVKRTPLGAKGKLVRDAGNEYDSNAVQILLTDEAGNEVFVGFVSREMNQGIAPIMDTGQYEVEVCEIVGMEGTLKPVFFIKVNDLSEESEDETGDEVYEDHFDDEEDVD